MTSWQRFQRSQWALGAIFALTLGYGALGCGDWGGGSTGAARVQGNPSTPPATPAPPTGTGTQTQRVVAVLAWAPASGPVDAYRVYVEWDGSGSFDPHEDVPSAAVAIEGDVGRSIRMQVAALDSLGAEGPRSPASKPIVLTSRMPSVAGSSATAARTAPHPAPAPASEAEREAPSPEEPGELAPVVGDIDGDGRPDLLWESEDGRLRITGADLAVWLELDRPGPEWSFVGQGDVDTDGRGDLLWQGADGEVAFTRAALLPLGPEQAPLESWMKLSPGEVVEAVADYDGDGLADALVRDPKGLTLWLARDSAFELVTATPPEPGARLTVPAVDLDADGHVDLVWTTESGALMAQFLVVGRVDGVAALAGVGDPLAAADFGGDGADRLLFREPEGWIARGQGEPAGPWSVTVPDGTTLVGCADYDADGTADLLWSAGGSLHFAYLPGEEVASADPGWVPMPLCR